MLAGKRVRKLSFIVLLPRSCGQIVSYFVNFPTTGGIKKLLCLQMIWNENRSIRIAILDMNDGAPNQGMRCIRKIVKDWAASVTMDVTWAEFDVRKKNEIPDTSFDVYISSGGPGDPLSTLIVKHFINQDGAA